MSLIKIRNVNNYIFTLAAVVIFCFDLSSFAQDLNSFSIKDGEIIIESDSQNSDSINGVFTAYGDVKITYPEKNIIITSTQAQYLEDESIIVFNGDVNVIREGKDKLLSNRIVYFLDDDRLVADSLHDSQVELTILINSSESQPYPISP